jgi:hypothetical protein
MLGREESPAGSGIPGWLLTSSPGKLGAQQCTGRGTPVPRRGTPGSVLGVLPQTARTWRGPGAPSPNREPYRILWNPIESYRIL